MSVGNRVYFVELVGHDLIKIGSSASSLSRMHAIKAWSPFDLKFMAEAPGQYFAEAMVHDLFRGSLHRNEWFHVTTELRAFVDQVARTGKLPFDDLPDESAGLPYRAMSGAVPLLDRIGITVEQFGAKVGLKPLSVQGWSFRSSTAIPLRHGPAILKLAREAGLAVTAADLFPSADQLDEAA